MNISKLIFFLFIIIVIIAFAYFGFSDPEIIQKETIIEINNAK